MKSGVTDIIFDDNGSNVNSSGIRIFYEWVDCGLSDDSS